MPSIEYQGIKNDKNCVLFMLVLLRKNLSIITVGADTRVSLGDIGETGRQKPKEQISF